MSVGKGGFEPRMAGLLVAAGLFPGGPDGSAPRRRIGRLILGAVGLTLVLSVGVTIGWVAHEPPAPSAWQRLHPLVTVPSVVTLTYRQASELVVGRGLDPRRRGTNEPAADAIVLSQDPATGTQVPKGTSVWMKVTSPSPSPSP